jgi:predicted AlkP superfamily phosphohydrolase/phosphomutase/tetratricopeptide (TPR) repeat protein
MAALPGQRKVLLIGWDAADWKIISPLLDGGKMPHLSRLVSDGVMGNLATLQPILSPMLWTSIATGKRAHKHGIHGFTEPDSRTGTIRPITNLGRKTKAIWNILNQNGKRSNVIGWWPSHPAEPIDGVMVSNHYQQAVAALDQPWPMRPGTVHPARLAEALLEFRIHPEELEAEQILPFVPDAAKVDQKKDPRLAQLAKILAETASVHAAATAVMQLEPWDFMAVYFDGIDHFCHGFMKYHPPRLDWVPADDCDMYKDVVNGAYQFHDMMLGTMMTLAGDDATIMIVSDHGFHPDHLRPKDLPNEPAGPADEHRPFGVFAMKGPGVKKDALIYGASLLDITPTILTLFGLPVGQDMDGKPLVAAFERTPLVTSVETWDAIEGDAGTHPPDMQVDAVDTLEAMKQLVDLGYIDKPDENREKALAATVKELRYNLARDYFDARHIAEAISLFDELWAQCPEESRFGVKVLECYLALGQAASARETLERLVRQKQQQATAARNELAGLLDRWGERKAEAYSPDERRHVQKLRRLGGVNAAAFSYLNGCVLYVEGKLEAALEAFRSAGQVHAHNLPSLYQRVGDTLLRLERWAEAEEQFLAILAVDPVNAAAHLGLCQCHLACRRPVRALHEAMAAIGLVFHNPLAHYVCGRALRRLRQPRKAIKAFETALSQNPVFPEVHEELALIYDARGAVRKAQEHRKLADSARRHIAEFKAGAMIPKEAELGVDATLAESASVGDWRTDGGGPLDAGVAVVVSGLPRSGTSMMMQMLAAGGLPVLTDGERQPDDSNPRGYFELERAKRGALDTAWLDEAQGKAVKIVAQTLMTLPLDRRYRVIFMERPLGEVIASQLQMLKRLGRTGGRLSERQLAATYQQQVGQLRWVLSRAPRDVRVLSVRYAEVLADPARIAARVNAFLGGELDEASMIAAVEPALRNQHTERSLSAA